MADLMRKKISTTIVRKIMTLCGEQTGCVPRLFFITVHILFKTVANLDMSISIHMWTGLLDSSLT